MKKRLNKTKRRLKNRRKTRRNEKKGGMKFLWYFAPLLGAAAAFSGPNRIHLKPYTVASNGRVPPPPNEGFKDGVLFSDDPQPNRKGTSITLSEKLGGPVENALAAFSDRAPSDDSSEQEVERITKGLGNR
jgi:hypothetical protein